jgi:hypothetical protein
MIAKQTPQTSEHPLAFHLPAAYPQQDKSDFSNGEQRHALTGERHK